MREREGGVEGGRQAGREERERERERERLKERETCDLAGKHDGLQVITVDVKVGGLHALADVGAVVRGT